MLRYAPYALSALAAVFFLVRVDHGPINALLLAVSVGLVLLGTWDVLQTRHTLLRNYPLVGHLRWIFESIRPQIQQYFIHDDLHGAPFNREQRSLIYARAKGENDFEPFGTEADVYRDGYEWIGHTVKPADVHEPPRLVIGGPQSDQPYEASLLNISAMSFGALSGPAIAALNAGARLGNFAHDTGEGGISVHHRQGGDLIWELGSGYFGCRTSSGDFDPEQFSDQARDPHVRMIELKLSQGAKAGHGGILPGAKVTPEIADARGVQVGEDCVSPSSHGTFSTPAEMLTFIGRLRELSGGKPVGIKLCIGQPVEFLGICKAMLETGIHLDFVVIDGKEGGTGAAPEEFSDRVGMPLQYGLLFARNALVGAGLAEHVRIGASGKVVTGFDMARCMALGADWCNAARPFMFAVGCIQSQRCHTGTCPTGVATQDPWRQRGLVVSDKSTRVARYHRETLKSLMDLIAAAGVDTPGDLNLEHIWQRNEQGRITTLASMHAMLAPGELCDGADDAWYREQWNRASAAAFSP